MISEVISRTFDNIFSLTTIIGVVLFAIIPIYIYGAWFSLKMG